MSRTMPPLPGELESSPALFLFAHPDDDVFACGLMSRLVQSGADVHAAWATSGEAGGSASVREEELRRAMDMVGLPEENRHLLRFPNRGMLPVLRALSATVGELLDSIRPRNVFVTAYEGGHIDHDALHLAACYALRRRSAQTECWEFPLYNAAGPLLLLRNRVNAFPDGRKGGGTVHVPLTRQEALLKHMCMLDIYRSQRGDMLPFRILMGAGRYIRRGEPYRRCDVRRDYSVPPHEGRLGYEGGATAPRRADFSEFKAAAAALLQDCDD